MAAAPPPPDPDGLADRSDWSDLDLLTVSEATGRLDDEIAAVRHALAAEPPPSAAERATAEHRLELLHRARARAANPTARLTPGRVRTRAEIDATPGPPD